MKPREDRDRHGPPRVMASAPSVVQQARLMDAAGTAWHAVKCGNLEMITKLFPNQCNVYAKGPVGENVLHVAMLLNTPSTLAITRYFVKLYGSQLVNCPIQERKQQHDPPGTYEGQTALHIAIVNRDFDMVKFLVQSGANIRARAWGKFFRQDGPMYYGEFPLSFAACTGQKDIVAYLKRHGAQVNSDCDVFGNTALHMCVIHDQPDMYDFLVDYCAASDAVRNYQGLTPLVLAAQLGKADMLQHIYNRRRRAFYSFGKVRSYSLALREIDTVQDEDENGAAGPDGGYVPNALEAVLRKRHLDMLQEPLLATLLQHKWEAFARAQFMIHFAGYLLLEISQTVLIWLHSDPGWFNGPARASQEFLGIFLALVMLGVELLDYAYWSRECYHRRLTMSVHGEQDPPLYPIPGEMRDARDNRQSIFARLSARMGFAGASSGTSTGQPSHLAPRSEGGFGSTSRQGSPHRNASHPGFKPPTDAATASGGDSSTVQGLGTSVTVKASSRPSGASQPAAVEMPSSVQRVQLQQQQQPWLVGPSVTDSKCSGSPTAVSASSPSRGGQQFYRRSHDDPIDLRPRTGDVVLGEGRSPLGVGVVDTGFTTEASLAHSISNASANADAAAAAADRSTTHSSSSGRPLKSSSGPGPVGEATEDDAAAAAAVQQHGAAAEAADVPVPAPPVAGVAFSRIQRGSSTGDMPLSNSSSRQDDDDDAAFDVVSVGLRSGRMRSYIAESASSNAIAAAAAGSSDGAAAAVPAQSVSASGAKTVKFSDTPNLLGRASSGRLSGNVLASNVDRSLTSSPRPSNIMQQPQPMQAVATPFILQPQLAGAAAVMSAGDSGSTLGTNYSGSHAQDPMRTMPRHLDAVSTPPGVPSGWLDGVGRTHSSSAAAAAGAVVRPATASEANGAFSTPSFSRVPSMQRARSFHGINAGLAGVSTVDACGSSVIGDRVGSGSTMSRAMTGGEDMLQGITTTSNATDQLQAVQMLERQRTRARSGGGDLPAAHALKRSNASKPKPAVGIGASNAAAADASAHGGGAAGGSGGKDGSVSDLGTLSKGGDFEKGPPADILDPHKSRMRAMLETTYEGAVRMLEDPWLFIWHLHLLLTCIHFITWISSYGFVGGSGPKSLRVREFDDVIVSMMGMSGWLAVIYFFRGLKATGKLAVILERCIVDVCKFVSLYVLWNLGFALAFYTMENGVIGVGPYDIDRDTKGIVELSDTEPDPFSSIGNSMITLINLGTGLSYYEYAMTCKTSFVLSMVLCTFYYLVYLATVVLLLMNLLIAMIINTWNSTQGIAELYWKHRWAIYTIKAERRLPQKWVQRLRLGQLTWDPVSNKHVYSHVFETVDEDKSTDSSKTAVDGQIKAVESLLEDLKKRRSST